MESHKQLLDKEYETLLQQFSKELEKLQIKHQQELEKRVFIKFIINAIVLVSTSEVNRLMTKTCLVLRILAHLTYQKCSWWKERYLTSAAISYMHETVYFSRGYE